MAIANDSARHAAGKLAPIPCTAQTCDALNALLAVDSQPARLTLDVDVLGKPCIRLILDDDAALDLAVRITGAVMRQRRAATA
jgi:hypothetical protein